MMDLGLEEQTRAFLFAITMGLGFGLFFDLLHGVRLITKAGKILTAAFDILYCLICCGVFFVFTLSLALGQIRFFSLGGCAGGMLLYFAGISPIVMGVFQKISKVMYGFCKTLSARKAKRKESKKQKKMRCKGEKPENPQKSNKKV